ncbi:MULTISPECIES: alpha-amylase family protein [unclassified Janthinobacterium]|uniref:alpha-amylase family protein n=1 Tax=unclassified Janthinobacterium TaxID=2610881 RepID=UPI00180659E7|nr:MULTISPECIES: alpha-amylase family protein [unclassified Janthinobacterium]MBB5371186.1 amylosucrase [Janthinobacterium sp. K2C7]MBB5383992.1 amylosucrase [Janthinobacterium sp. K2Li3]MBB5389186.1 amylosucrase [Janthinobacterium sp. K2E3]
MMSDLTPLERLLEHLPTELRAEAARRYARHETVLFERLARLYGGRRDFLPWFCDLMENLGRLHAARPAALLQLDAERLQQPDWFASQSMLGYSTYVQRFGGSLNGVAGRIAHLRELGVTYLHLLPFLRPRAGESDGGFAVASFDEVDPELGSNADLEALTAQLRAAGISLCSDLILNHVADDHAWALGAKNGDPLLREFFHTYPDRDMPDRYEATMGQIFPQAAPGNFTFDPSLQRWVWTTFYPYQWDLNYANPAVFTAMMCAMLGLANRGVEVFRLDSTAFLWKREGTDCMNQPEAHWLLQAMRAIIDIVAPGVLMKAEAIVATPKLPAYFGSEGNGGAPECHIAYHSSLMAAGWGALAEQNTDLLREVVRATPPLPPSACWLSYVRCHDDIGWNVLLNEAGTDGPARLARIASFFAGANGSYARGDAFQSSSLDKAHGSNGMAASLSGLESAADTQQTELALRRLLLLHGLALSFGALPMLYMGDELGMTNDYSYIKRPDRAMDSRWLQRPPFDDSLLALRHDRDSVTGRLFSGLRQLIALRSRHEALAADAPRSLLPSSDGAVLALMRGPDFLNLSNFSGHDAAFELPAGRWRDGISGAELSGKVSLPSWAMLWLERTV